MPRKPPEPVMSHDRLRERIEIIRQPRDQLQEQEEELDTVRREL